MDDDRTYLNTIIHIRDGFEYMSDRMSDRMSELEKERLTIVLDYLNRKHQINSSGAAEILGVKNKTASRLLAKAESMGILSSEGEKRYKVYKCP